MHKNTIDKVNFLWYNTSEKRRTQVAYAIARKHYIDFGVPRKER